MLEQEFIGEYLFDFRIFGQFALLFGS